MSNPEENPPPYQQNPQPDDEATSRPRQRARAPHNMQLTLGPREPSRALLPPITRLNSDWICSICGMNFFHMWALSGHMRVHKNRTWKGIHPPPELCKPQGLGVINDLYSKKDDDPVKGNDRMLPSLIDLGGGVTVGGGGGGMSQSLIPWVPLHNPNYQGTFGSAGDVSKEEGRSLGKRHMWEREEERFDEPLRRSKRTRVGNVPDLNLSPPQHDEPEAEEGAKVGNDAPDAEPIVEKGEGSNATHVEPEAVVEAGEASNAPHAESHHEVEGGEKNNAPHVESEPKQDGTEGNDAPHDEPKHKEDGINTPHNEPEPKEEDEIGSNAHCDIAEEGEPESGHAVESLTETEGGARDDQ